MKFYGVGISHIKAAFELREKIALNEDESKQFMLLIKDTLEVSDLLTVSTCNRTEIYYTSSKNHNDVVIRLLSAFKGISSFEIKTIFEKYAGKTQAIEHLFSVGTGLLSQVVGDMQIPNQIKKAYQWSVDINMAGPYLHRLMHMMFYTNKRVAQETSFRDGAASTSYATVSFIEQLSQSNKAVDILVLGLGEIGEDLARCLADEGYTQVKLCTRTLAKAERLSQEIGYEYFNIEALDQNLNQFQFIISSTAADHPIIKADMIKPSLQYLYIFDLAVPRSLTKEVSELPGVVVYNIDEIQKRANAALENRLKSVPMVEQIVAESVNDFDNWAIENLATPTIQKFKESLEIIRKEELNRYMKNLTETEKAVVEKVTMSMIQKILKEPVVKLKAACKRGDAENLIGALTDLFDLEKSKAH